MTVAPKFGLGIALLLFGSGVLTSCHDANDPGTEYAPQMYDSVPVEPLRQVNGHKNPYNPMGINERVPPQGAIPRGKLAYFTHIAPDSISIAERVLHNPYSSTPENLEAGKVLYGRYCQHCHGEAGDGNGPVGAKFKGVPNYATGAYKNMNAGHIFHVIQYGKGRMMPHGSQVSPEDRWKIALYVYTLQHKDDPQQAISESAATAAPTTETAPALPTATVAAPTAVETAKPAAVPAPAATSVDTRTPVQRATDKIRQTHVF